MEQQEHAFIADGNAEKAQGSKLLRHFETQLFQQKVNLPLKMSLVIKKRL